MFIIKVNNKTNELKKFKKYILNSVKEISEHFYIDPFDVLIENDEELSKQEYIIYFNEEIVSQGKSENFHDFYKILKLNSYKTYTPEQMYKNIKNLMQEYPHITRDLKTSEVKIKTIHKVIEKLLMSGLAMRKFKEIIELVIFHSEENFNLDLLAFAVRSELRNEVLINNIARDGKIDGILLNKQDEEEIPYYELNREFYLAMDDIRKNILVERIKEIEKVAEEFSAKPILVVNKVWTSILLRELFIQNDIDIVVLTNHELYERDHQYSGTHILGELNTRDIAKNKEPQGNAEVEKLRRELIEKALKEKDRDLFEKMTSSNWEDYL